MGIFTKLATTWKSMTTKDKIGLVIDVISGVGCGLGSMIVGSKLSEGQGRIKGACIKTAVAGLGLAACDVSSKALKENYGDIAAGLIDKAKARAAKEKAQAAEDKMKEAVAHE